MKTSIVFTINTAPDFTVSLNRYHFCELPRAKARGVVFLEETVQA